MVLSTICCCSVFVLSVSDRWLALSQSTTDPKLKELALGALPKLLMSSRANSTTKKYSNTWKRWESWASSKTNVKSFPVNPTDFALYLSSFYSSGHKTAADSAAAAAHSVDPKSEGTGNTRNHGKTLQCSRATQCSIRRFTHPIRMLCLLRRFPSF